jgi:hypothetical protein
MNPSDGLKPAFNGEGGNQLPKQDQSARSEALPNGIASRQHAEDLLKQVSAPRYVFNYTPMGVQASEVRSEHDKRLIEEAHAILQRLDRRRQDARDTFNMRVDGWGGEHTRPRRKM